MTRFGGMYKGGWRSSASKRCSNFPANMTRLAYARDNDATLASLNTIDGRR